MAQRAPRWGLYDKAIPIDLDWPERFAFAKRLEFDFIEMSIDETDHRLERLRWRADQRKAFRDICADSGMRASSICLSAHRRFPFGSADPAIRAQARDIMARAIDLSLDIGARVIQLAGYDVYYEPSTPQSIERFAEGLAWAAERASAMQVMLAVEIMDIPMMGSITAWKNFKKAIPTPWLQVYPDVGNLSAWSEDVDAELRLGAPHIVAIHLKDTLKPRENFKGQFRDVPFGGGCVDFVKIFSSLRQLDYCGAFVIEMWSEKSDDAAKHIAQARAFLTQSMQKGGFLDV